MRFPLFRLSIKARPLINEAQEIWKGGGLLVGRRGDYHLDGTD